MITAPPSRVLAPPVPAERATDDELVQRVREGEERAFDEVYARYRVPLHRYCHSIVRQREDAEEAYQATMLSAYRTLSDPDGPNVSLRPWLYRIAHNACVSVLRRRPAEPPAALTGLEIAPGRIEERSELASDLRQLRQDLDHLSEGQRAALVMRELGGLGHEEIGRVLGEDAAVVKQLIYNARLALHDLAAGRDMECDRVRRTLSDGDRRILRSRGLRAHVRACAACRSWQEALQTRPAKLAALAPALPAAALHEVLAAALGSAGAGAAGAGLAGGAATVAGLGAGGAGVGAGLAAKVMIIGSAALIGGGTAAVPALQSGPAGEPAPAIALRTPAASAGTGTPAAPVGGPVGVPVTGTAHADLGAGRSEAAGPSASRAADPAGEEAPAAVAGVDDDRVMEHPSADDGEIPDGQGQGPGQNPNQGPGQNQGQGQGSDGVAGPPAHATTGGEAKDKPVKPEQAGEPGGTQGNGQAPAPPATDERARGNAAVSQDAAAAAKAAREAERQTAEVPTTPAAPAAPQHGKPDDTGKPAGTGQPAEAGKPAETGQPAEAGKPAATGKPAETATGKSR